MKNVRDYTITDALFQIVRMMILVTICRYTCVVGTKYMTEYEEEADPVGKSSEISYWVVMLLVLLGVVVYNGFFWIFKMIMSTCFKCELLGAQDFCLTLDSPENRHMICTMAFLEKFEYINMREHLNKKTKMIHNCRS